MNAYWEYVCESDPSVWFVSSNPDLVRVALNGGRMVCTNYIEATGKRQAYAIARVWREVEEGKHDTQNLRRPHRPSDVWEDRDGDIVVHYDAFEFGGIPWETKVA